MNNTCIAVKNESEFLLGKQVAPDKKYNPDILTPFSRIESLKSCNVEFDSSYEWYGLDIWNLWEVRYKNLAGLSFANIGKLVYSAKSPRMIESKSMKLYFMGLAYERFKSKEDLKNLVIKDISERTGDEQLMFKLYNRNNYYNNIYATLVSGEYNVISFLTKKTNKEIITLPQELADVNDFYFENEKIEDTDSLVDVESSQKISVYKSDDNIPMKVYLYDAGASNCLVTKQKDYCTDIIIIDYLDMINNNISGDLIYPDKKSLVEYLQFFEDINRFHESTTHTIFNKLVTTLREYNPHVNVTILSMYTRRGGIDINPFRTTSKRMLNLMKDYCTYYSWAKGWNQ